MEFERNEVEEYRGLPPPYDAAPDDGPVREFPATRKRRRARAFSRRYGWIYDLIGALWYYVASWFTTDVMLGWFRAGYGLIMAAILSAIIYSLYYAADRMPPRVLPTVDELMKRACHDDEGPLNPMDGY